MRLFVIINNVEMKINVDANVKNWLIKVCVINDKGVCDKGVCDKNPSNCECECDDSCDVGEYLDYEKFKRQLDRLVDECAENIDEVKILDNNESKYNS